MKALVATDSDRILGFAMIGPEAGEVMAVVQIAMLAGLPCTDLRDAVIAHPTMAEGLGPLLSKLPPRSRDEAPETAQASTARPYAATEASGGR